MKALLSALTAATLALALTGIPGFAAGQPICGARDDLKSDLEKSYSETPIARGLATAGMMIEVFASAEGTFTIVATRPDGTSCLMAAGEAWHELAAVAATPSGSF
jgi:hypothetical protein